MFPRTSRRPECFWFVLLFFGFWAGSSTQLIAREEDTPPSSTEPPLCEMKIEGNHIEQIVLSHNNQNQPDNDITFNRPAESVQLPAGEYHVKEIHLQGGYACGLPLIPGITGPEAEKYGWFTLSPSKPHTLSVTTPLVQKLGVHRIGQLLRFNYILSDKEGRCYTNEACNVLPGFTASCNGEVIGSGTMGRYG